MDDVFTLIWNVKEHLQHLWRRILLLSVQWFVKGLNDSFST